ncbi:MAG: hypothetical protein ABIH83_05455 [Candidatus Micrarchaeota archaeon]
MLLFRLLGATGYSEGEQTSDYYAEQRPVDGTHIQQLIYERHQKAMQNLIPAPSDAVHVSDYELRIKPGDWKLWDTPTLKLETINKEITETDVILRSKPYDLSKKVIAGVEYKDVVSGRSVIATFDPLTGKKEDLEASTSATLGLTLTMFEGSLLQNVGSDEEKLSLKQDLRNYLLPIFKDFERLMGKGEDLSSVDMFEDYIRPFLESRVEFTSDDITRIQANFDNMPEDVVIAVSASFDMVQYPGDAPFTRKDSEEISRAENTKLVNRIANFVHALYGKKVRRIYTTLFYDPAMIETPEGRNLLLYQLRTHQYYFRKAFIEKNISDLPPEIQNNINSYLTIAEEQAQLRGVSIENSIKMADKVLEKLIQQVDETVDERAQARARWTFEDFKAKYAISRHYIDEDKKKTPEEFAASQAGKNDWLAPEEVPGLYLATKILNIGIGRFVLILAPEGVSLLDVELGVDKDASRSYINKNPDLGGEVVDEVFLTADINRTNSRLRENPKHFKDRLMYLAGKANREHGVDVVVQEPYIVQRGNHDIYVTKIVRKTQFNDELEAKSYRSDIFVPDRITLDAQGVRAYHSRMDLELDEEDIEIEIPGEWGGVVKLIYGGSSCAPEGRI